MYACGGDKQSTGGSQYTTRVHNECEIKPILYIDDSLDAVE